MVRAAASFIMWQGNSTGKRTYDVLSISDQMEAVHVAVTM